MRAVCWHGTSDVRVDTVPDPKIADPTDAIIRITSTAICGSDLHLYDGMMPTMQAGDVLGHEPMGVVEEVGKGVGKLKKGDRVVVPFCIACGGEHRSPSTACPSGFAWPGSRARPRSSTSPNKTFTTRYRR
jgi:threonine dehydrogenase-like Zn-dependent dehydrogenase